ncbi:MAG: ribonuclease III [Myxococcota bacterium]|nr:ribonuclease III [Myxococcota bacterium]
MEPEPRSRPNLAELEARLGYSFHDRSLLETALRHASRAYEEPGTESNERMEFLGDAVIGLVVAHSLYEAHPAWEEGDLSRALQQLVDRPAFAALALRLELAPHLQLGRTELQSGGDAKESILANAMEAVVGALHLDGGLEAVRELVQRVYGEALGEGAPRPPVDVKTRFQEEVMARHGEFPRYELLADSGVEGDHSRFTTRAVVRDEYWGSGSGRTKRAAEFAAAQEGLARLEGQGAGDD